MGTTRDPPPLIGQAPAWVEILQRISAAAPLDRPILVIGERGTGKELVAARLHFLSGRWDKTYLAVNCAALPEDLLDSELFGHEAGAFTGAAKRHIGRFERADGGCLFLDEIATASTRVQEKLLRVIEYGEFERLGGDRTLSTDVRLIAATNVDLPALAAKGRFRADLLDRLAFDVITLPPLRARTEDIPVLAEHFGRRMAREIGASFPGFSNRAMAAMLAHAWPGNVRELKNTVERAVYRALAAGEASGPIEAIPLDPFESRFRPLEQIGAVAGLPPVAAEKGAAVLPAASSPYAGLPFDAAVLAFEKSLLSEALTATQGNQTLAAERLGLSYHQLRNALRKHELIGQARAIRKAPREA